MSDPQQPAVPPYASSPGQHPQPGYPAQPMPTPLPTPQPYYQGQPPAAGAVATNPPGRLSLTIGIVGLALSLLSTVGIQAMIGTGNFAVITYFAAICNIVVFIAAAAALICGAIGLKRRDAPHGPAGIGVGLGVAGVTSGIMSFLITSLSALLY